MDRSLWLDSSVSFRVYVVYGQNTWKNFVEKPQQNLIKFQEFSKKKSSKNLQFILLEFPSKLFKKLNDNQNWVRKDVTNGI